MTDCSSITDCITCITSVLKCFFILTGSGIAEKWSCVSSVAGRSGVRMTVRDETREFCPSPTTTTTIGNGNEIVTYMAFALALFCLIGICVMAYWARKEKRMRASPPPPRPPQPNPTSTAHLALTSLTTFARRREEERVRSRAIFNERNAAFQRELAERLERVRSEREAAYPGTPRNTPDPIHPPNHVSRQLSQPPPSINTPRRSQPPTRHGSVDPQSQGSSAWSSRSATPAATREPTPFSREATPVIPSNPSPTSSNEHIYDSPASTYYESMENSPLQSPPSAPSLADLEDQEDETPIPSPPRSRFGRLLKQTSFFKCNP